MVVLCEYQVPGSSTSAYLVYGDSEFTGCWLDEDQRTAVGAISAIRGIRLAAYERA
jgi:hypothetical protein